MGTGFGLDIVVGAVNPIPVVARWLCRRWALKVASGLR